MSDKDIIKYTVISNEEGPTAHIRGSKNKISDMLCEMMLNEERGEDFHSTILLQAMQKYCDKKGKCIYPTNKDK